MLSRNTVRTTVFDMPELGRPQIAVYLAAAIAVGLIGAHFLSQQSGASADTAAGTTNATSLTGGSLSKQPSDASVSLTEAQPASATVHVVGAVKRPGVYRMSPGARVNDAVARAGGATAGADLTGVNLAAKVEDGRQVIVPIAGVGVTGSGLAGAGAGGTAGMASAPLNLNTATAQQLDTLDGVGPATAQKILAYREAHGGFRSVDELGEVPGIGDKRLAALREMVRV